MKNIHKTGLYSRIRKAAAVGAVIAGLLGAAVTAHAANAEGFWKQDEIGWWVQFSDGSYARQMWLNDGSDWYAFDSDGYMITDWQWIDGDWYYFGQNGAMQTGWVQDTDGIWYLLDATSGAMLTGWQEDAGKWYYLYSNGSMAKDTWVDSYYLDVSGAWDESAVRQEDYASELTGTIDGLRTKYPDGMYWNHMGSEGAGDYSEFVTGTPCNHLLYGLDYCNTYILGNVRGYQCDGFARKLSDEVFGRDAGMTAYAYSFDKVKVGDYLRYSTTKGTFVVDGHSVFVIGKTEDSLRIAEANYGGTCMIRWDGILSREYLDSIYAECFTRY